MIDGRYGNGRCGWVGLLCPLTNTYISESHRNVVHFMIKVEDSIHWFDQIKISVESTQAMHRHNVPTVLTGDVHVNGRGHDCFMVWRNRLF